MVVALDVGIVAFAVHSTRRPRAPTDILLLDGGYNLVTAYDLGSRRTRYIYLPDKVPGDHMYSFAVLGDRLVYPSVNGIRSHSLLTGRDIFLGRAWDYRPDDGRGSIWLFESKDDSSRMEATEVSATGKTLSAKRALPQGTETPVAAIDGHILLNTGVGLVLYDARRQVVENRYDEDVQFVTTRRQMFVVATGCFDMLTGCTGLRTIDVRTGRERMYGQPLKGLFWMPFQGRHSARLSGDLRYIAADVHHDRNTEPLLIAFDLKIGQAARTFTSGPALLGQVTWSSDPGWLVFQHSERYAADRIGEPNLVSYNVPCCAVTVATIPSGANLASTDVPTCRAKDLRARIRGNPQTTAWLSISGGGAEPCIVQGPPRLVLYARDGSRLATSKRRAPSFPGSADRRQSRDRRPFVVDGPSSANTTLSQGNCNARPLPPGARLFVALDGVGEVPITGTLDERLPIDAKCERRSGGEPLLWIGNFF